VAVFLHRSLRYNCAPVKVYPPEYRWSAPGSVTFDPWPAFAFPRCSEQPCEVASGPDARGERRTTARGRHRELFAMPAGYLQAAPSAASGAR